MTSSVRSFRPKNFGDLTSLRRKKRRSSGKKHKKRMTSKI